MEQRWAVHVVSEVSKNNGQEVSELIPPNNEPLRISRAKVSLKESVEIRSKSQLQDSPIRDLSPKLSQIFLEVGNLEVTVQGGVPEVQALLQTLLCFFEELFLVGAVFVTHCILLSVRYFLDKGASDRI